MLWSRCPCVAIITSASSRTNIVIFLGSMSLYLVHQSRTVPGVPMTICSCSGTPRSTEEEILRNNIKTTCLLWALNTFFRPVIPSNIVQIGYTLTFVAPNAICQFDIRTKLPHLFDDLTDLQSQLICWRDAKTLKEPNRFESRVYFSESATEY